MKEEFENELRELSPFLADLKKRQADDPFKTPKLYFEHLADAVELREAAPFLADLKKQPMHDPFKTPVFYFETLANAVELRELSPFLADLKQKQADRQPFKTPKFYFDSLPDKVLAAAKSEEKETIISTKRTPQYQSLLEQVQGFAASIFQPKWALAFASLALVAVVGGYALMRGYGEKTVLTDSETAVVFAPTNENIPTNLENIEIVDNAQVVVSEDIKALSEIPKMEIQNYINENLTDFDEAIFIEHAPQLAEVLTGKDAANEQPLTHPKSGLTEEELELYLKEYLEDGDLNSSDNKF